MENCRVDECWKLFYVKTNARRGGFVDGITLKGVNAGKVKDAIRLPWMIITEEWEVLTPSDLSLVFSGYEADVRW